MPLAKRQFTALKKLKSGVLVLTAVALCLLALAVFTPKDSIIGTWQNEEFGSSSQPRISVKFQANGKEMQQLQTPQGLLVVRGNYALDTIILKHTFLSASLNGKPTKLPVSSPSVGYRCKVAGNALELDSRALAAEVPGEHFLPLEGQQLLLLRVDSIK